MVDPRLKAEIEAMAGISNWHPTDDALQRISRELDALKGSGLPVSRKAAAMIVLRHTRADIKPFAGIDTNDISALLTLAMKHTKR